MKTRDLSDWERYDDDKLYHIHERLCRWLHLTDDEFLALDMQAEGVAEVVLDIGRRWAEIRNCIAKVRTEWERRDTNNGEYVLKHPLPDPWMVR